MSDIPSSSWCTNWEAYNTPRLWSMVAAEDNPEAWKQVIAWREVSDAVDAHLARLKQARETLEAAWPTGQSEASRAFVTRLNTLITRMEGARQEASSTSTALDHILQALRQAKQNIEPLWKQYRDKNEDVVPAWWDNAEEELDAQARAHMIHAEQVVQQYVPGIQVPDAYEFVLSSRLENDEKPATPGSGTAAAAHDVSSGDGGTSAFHSPPPPLPGHAVTASAGAIGAGGLGIHLSRDHQFANSEVPESTLNQPPSSRQPLTMLPPPGPELSEVFPAPSSPILEPKIVPPQWSPPLGNALPPSGFVPVIGPILGGRLGGVSSNARAASELTSFGAGFTPSMPPGGVIEAPMGKQVSSGTNLGRPAASSPRPAWLAAGGSGATEVAGGGMPSGIVKTRTTTEGKGPRMDPDNPWSAAQGVDPVIEPSRRPAVHDPGLGVIGQYR